MATKKDTQGVPKMPQDEVVVTRMLNGVPIRQWADGSWDGTAMCQADGKRWNDYWVLKSTEEYVAAVSATTRIPVVELVRFDNSGGNGERHTRVHELIAYELATWLSVDSKLTVLTWFREAVHAQAQATGQDPSQIFFDVLLKKKGKYKGFLTKRCVKNLNALNYSERLDIPCTPEMRKAAPDHYAGVIPNTTGFVWNNGLGEATSQEAKRLQELWKAKGRRQAVQELVADYVAGYTDALSEKAQTTAEFREGFVERFGDGSGCPWVSDGPVVAQYTKFEDAIRRGVDPRQGDLFDTV